MHQALQSASGFEDLLTPSSGHFPYDFTSIFVPEGMLGKRREKTRFKMLQQLDESIRAVLAEGEVVRMVSHGLENSIIEQMFLGWMVYYLNQTAFVLTDRRLLLFQVNSRRKPKTFIKQYRLDAIQKVSFGMGRSLKVTGADGKTSAFARLPGKDGKRLAQLLQESIRPGAGVRAGKENLCPSCYHPVQGIPDTCPGCSQPFKSPRKAGFLSLLFPGLGDLYLGHVGFAVLELTGGAILWMMVMLGLMAPSPGVQPLSALGAFMTSAILLVPFLHLPDAFATWRIGCKGLVKRKASPSQNALAVPNATKWR